MTNDYDYIIVGAGCAGLSLLMRMLDEPSLQSKKILLIDRGPKQQNDRTWCYWERGEGYFEPIVHHRWPNLFVKHPEGEKQLDLGEYSYKMILAGDFYRHCFERIGKSLHVHVQYGEVSLIDAFNGTVTLNDTLFKAGKIFSSALLTPPRLQANEWYLLQHFKGWWIETETDYFDAETADLMNFRTSQEHGCTFLYVLPVSKRRALIEYTLFTEQELDPGDYDLGLNDFIYTELKLKSWKITGTEKGIIPMTNLVFPSVEGKVVFIGTAGGQTKASTGYTFQFIQQHSQRVVKALVQHHPTESFSPRFRFYDSVLLRILSERKLSGASLFFRMFSRNKAWKVFKFLDNQTHLGEELAIMQSTEKSYFIPAAAKEWHALKKS